MNLPAGRQVPALQQALPVMCNFMRTFLLLNIILITTFNFVAAQNTVSQDFLYSKGSLPYPIEKVIEINSYEDRKHICNGDFSSKSTYFYTDSSYPVTAIFDCKISNIIMIEDFYVAIVQTGNYFIVYSGLQKPSVKQDDSVKKGQQISSVGKDLDGRYCVQVFISDGQEDLDPFPWFRPNPCTQLHITGLLQGWQHIVAMVIYDKTARNRI